MKKVLIIAAVVVASLGAFFLLRPDAEQRGTPADTRPVVKIGVIAPLSGNMTEFGNNIIAALELAKSDAAPKNIRVQYVFEDYALKPALAAVIANKMISVDKVDAIISWSAPAGSAVAPIADGHGVIHIAITNDKNAAKGKYNFTNFTTSEKYVEKFMESIRGKGYKNIAMFVIDNQPSIQQTADLLEQKLRGAGIASARHDFGGDLRNFDLLVEKVRRENHDAWYIASMPPSTDLFLKSFRAKNVGVPLLSIDAFNMVKEPALAEGMPYVSPAEADDGVLARVFAKTGSVNSFSISFVYDSGIALIGAYDKLAGGGAIATSNEIHDAFMRSQFVGSAGAYKIDADGMFQSEAIIKQIKDGKAEVVK